MQLFLLFPFCFRKWRKKNKKTHGTEAGSEILDEPKYRFHEYVTGVGYV